MSTNASDVFYLLPSHVPADARNALQSLTLTFPKAGPKVGFVGLDKDDKFVLYQPQNDTLGLHEWLGLNLSRSTGEYASQQQYVEVWITCTRLGLTDKLSPARCRCRKIYILVGCHR